MESTFISRPRTLECNRFVMMVGEVSMVRMESDVESVAHP